MTSKELENFIIEFTENTDPSVGPVLLGNTREELMMSAKLVGEEDPFALASYLESMSDESRDTFFKIVKVNRDKERKRDRERI